MMSYCKMEEYNQPHFLPLILRKKFEANMFRFIVPAAFSGSFPIDCENFEEDVSPSQSDHCAVGRILCQHIFLDASTT